VEHVLEDKEKRELGEHVLPRGERHLPSAHPKRLCDRVEEEDLCEPVESMSRPTNRMGKERAYGWSLHSKVGKEDALGTFPLLLWCRHLPRLQLPLAEVWDRVNDDPRYAATEIDGLGRWMRVSSFYPRVGEGEERTSWRMNEAMPVAIRGFPIQMYHAIHCLSNQLSWVKSVFKVA
jgi:hypothetical protein